MSLHVERLTFDPDDFEYPPDALEKMAAELELAHAAIAEAIRVVTYWATNRAVPKHPNEFARQYREQPLRKAGR